MLGVLCAGWWGPSRLSHLSNLTYPSAISSTVVVVVFVFVAA